jgi:hypothetical protein
MELERREEPVPAVPARERTNKERARYPHQWTFVVCAVEVEQWFRRYAPYERGFCIADETKTKDYLKATFQGLRMRRRSVAIPELTLDHLIDTIYFGNSHESRLLQLADACAFFVKRTVMNRDDAKPFYEVIEAQVSPQSLICIYSDL